jgi:acetyl-CoA carboxylase biotin carboxyl carrier protein
MRRPNASTQPQIIQHAAPVHYAPAMTIPVPAHAGLSSGANASRSTGGSASAPSALEDEAGLHRIESPMVGTFYASPKPDAKTFVAVGAAVTPETTVCIIEAMKIFNEIKAECAGTIEKILVKSGQAVEFGQPLFLVRLA